MKSSFTVKARFIPYTLQFKFDAGTSRGVLKKKLNYFVECRSDHFPGWVGYGEAGPLIGLSVDDLPDFDIQLNQLLQSLDGIHFSTQFDELLLQIKKIVPSQFPSIQFALETAILDLIHGGKRRIMPNDFYDKGTPIPINGLVWMGDKDTMWKQVEEKLAAGFDCIKIKIGALDFSQECELLGLIRDQFPANSISIRVDANGAFSPVEAMGKLQQLATFNLHSIEQPIRQGNINEMTRLCSESPVPIALDEELIGINSLADKINLLETIRPQYIILKPTLLGGLLSSQEWIRIAEDLGIGWWITSALEGNIGLNAIAQFSATYATGLPQGLGTGQLYDNNIPSPLTISKGTLSYGDQHEWGNIAGLFS
ncbi:o-succinylbenzoate synthase [Lunatibacter salilacus]|uniref:o-succinylbenzoate synthase n=1 Tax=Lunatibacter salilacus TaxID=2483804 RepID=UPI00131B0177|nr:o-succinylbenzoate synthase [Lunatibacter salilacus]